MHVDSVALPAGFGGKRLFDEKSGTKKHKMDLEASVTYQVNGISINVCFCT